MPKYAYDGVMQLWFVPTLTLSAPTLAQVTAGTNLTPYLRSLTTPFAGSTVDAATADSRFNSTVAGRYGGQPLSATFTRDKLVADDDAYTTLAFGTTGYWAVAWRGGTGGSGALAATDRIDAFYIEVLSRQPADYSPGSLAEVTVEVAVPIAPNFDVALT